MFYYSVENFIIGQLTPLKDIIFYEKSWWFIQPYIFKMISNKIVNEYNNEYKIFIYYNLKEKGEPRSLLEGLDVDDKNDMLFITKEYINKENKKSRKYARFKFFSDFIQYLEDNLKENNLHEVILPNRKIKPFLDVDMINIPEKFKPEKNLGYIIDAAIEVFKFLMRELDLSKDIRIHTSHGKTEKGYKYSYLIVFDNFCVLNIEVAEYIAKLIIQKLNERGLENISKYIDSKVYTPKHTIRCLGSTKLKENRVRKLEYKWNYYSKGKENQEIILYKKYKDDEYSSKCEDLERSLITNIRYDGLECEFLPIKLPEIKKEFNIENIDLNEYQIKYILKKVFKEIDKDDFKPDINNIENNRINLKRLRPSYCKLCNKEHDNDNQFVSFGEKGLYLKCWRNISKYKRIGDFPLIKSKNKEKGKERTDTKKTGLIFNIRKQNDNESEDDSDSKSRKSNTESITENSSENDFEENKDSDLYNIELSDEARTPSKDKYWDLIIENQHEGHAKLFKELAGKECFSGSLEKDTDIWILNKDRNLWTNAPKPTDSRARLIDKIIEVNGSYVKKWVDEMNIKWNKKLRKIKGKNKLIDKIENELKEINGTNKKKLIKNVFDSNWTEAVVKRVIEKIRDDNRAKNLNRKVDEIACPPCHVIDLKTGKVRLRKAEDNWSEEINIEYNPKENKKDIEWEETMAKFSNNNKEISDKLRDILGSSLTGRAKRKYFYYFLSIINGGKSTLLNIIVSVMGDYFAGSGSNYTFTTNNNKGEIISGLLDIMNKRLVVLSELREFDILDDVYISKMIGGDQISSRNPHKGLAKYYPMFAFIIAANFKPNFQNQYLYSKLHALELTSSFVDNPKNKGEFQSIIDIEDKIKEDNELMKAILRWMVKGAVNFTSNENKIPLLNSSLKLIRKLKHDDDLMGLYFEEYIEKYEDIIKEEIREKLKSDNENIDEDKLEEQINREYNKIPKEILEEKKYTCKVRCADFNGNYRSFIEDECCKSPPSFQKITKEMLARGYERERKPDDWHYFGIRFLPKTKNIRKVS